MSKPTSRPSPTTLASTAPEPARGRDRILATCDEILRAQTPNLYRLWLNPHVAAACVCLQHAARSAFPGLGVPLPSFLANGFDDALSGAIKLARYAAGTEGRTRHGWLVGADPRLQGFASIAVREGDIALVPELTAIAAGTELEPLPEASFAVLFHGALAGAGGAWLAALRERIADSGMRTVAVLDRASLGALRRGERQDLRAIEPDVVLFDESFVAREAPFAAFTAKAALYGLWMGKQTSNFHSTTFQPNALSSLHFLRCLREDEPELWAEVAGELARIDADVDHRRRVFASLYSPSLARTVETLRFDRVPMRAAGAFIHAGDRKIFDGVAGVACSIRGHNPEGYSQELRARQGRDDRAEMAAGLRELTGLPHVLPAVSGANAVENALRLGLAAQFPKDWVLAFRGGFGGKTLFALTGTAREKYKEHLGQLYEKVVYVDPFAADARAALLAALESHPVAIVQLELVQGVGGVTSIPDDVLACLAEHRARFGYLLFVDEVQTGMFRTGPFLMSMGRRIAPDLVTVGKGTSDMMFPFSLTLYGERVAKALAAVAPDLPATLARRADLDLGYATVANVLAFAKANDLARRVAETGALLKELLERDVLPTRAVRAVRAHGLLVGIELERATWPRRRIAGMLFRCYFLALLAHRPFPVLIGFCQYEPWVLKLTPPLTVTPDEIRALSDALAAVLRKPLALVVARAAWTLATAILRRKLRRKAAR